MAVLMMVTGVALAGHFTAAIATYFMSSDDPTHSTDGDTEQPNVGQELAAMKASLDRFHLELNQLRVVITEITGHQGEYPPTNTQIANEETERRRALP